MRDEMDDRIWESGHETFSASLGRSFDKLAYGYAGARRSAPLPGRHGPHGRGRVSRAGAGLAVLAGLMLAGIAAGPAQGAAPAENRILVSHADLNLAAPEGRRTLNGRIRQAARQVCGAAEVLHARAASDARKCENEAMVAARPQIEAAVERHRLLASRTAPGLP